MLGFSAPIKPSNGSLSTWHTPKLIAREVYETPGLPVEPYNILSSMTHKLKILTDIALAMHYKGSLIDKW